MSPVRSPVKKIFLKFSYAGIRGKSITRLITIGRLNPYRRTSNGVGKLKSRKSILKRFKRTCSGKILRRLSGQDHSRSKKTSKQIRQKRRWVPLHPSETKAIRRILVS